MILILSDIEIKKINICWNIIKKILFLIFYLFYAVKLLKTCNSIKNQLNMSIFINDITLLIYKQIIERNYQILKSTHDQYMNWACYYETFFALKKYDLIHLFKKFKKFNMQIQLQLKNLVKAFITSIHVLKIWLNSKLQWNEHVKIIFNKIKT